jgi:cellulose synthase/poly-beta-1,6-N-acetylglucosamine synthase-like glycosyltransferase
MTLTLSLAIVILLVWIGLGQEIFRGNRRLKRLTALTAPTPAAWPRVSVVFAARNEAATLLHAVPTMLALDYPDMEVIAVNDRSEDRTGDLLEQLAAANPRLKVVHVTELPEGWLGKNHALAEGSTHATGDWILFTDADVHFSPGTLQRAVAYARAQTLDHLSAVPALVEHGHRYGACINAFSLAFTLAGRPWRIPDPRSPAFGGIGAFNLVRTSTYRKLGGHVPIHLRPDDDIKLGKLMKSGGFSELVLGHGAISVSWYESVREMIHGLTKNAFAAADYRWWAAPASTLALVVGIWWPFVALGVATGPAWWCYLASVGIMWGLACDQARFTGGRWWYGFFLPVGMVVMNHIVWRSTIVTYWTGGITWRGTFYPLEYLKNNRV